MVRGYRTRKTILNERRMSGSICLPPTIRKDGLNSTQSYRMCYPGGSAQLGFAPPLLRVWPLTLMISFTSSLKSSVAQEIPSNSPPNAGRHKGLEKLRQKKQQCKKALKDLRKNGHADNSRPVRKLKADWQLLLQEHNKLRRAVKHKQDARARKFAKRQFNRTGLSMPRSSSVTSGNLAVQPSARNKARRISVTFTTTRNAQLTSHWKV